MRQSREVTETAVTPFRVDVPQEEVDDLAERLRRTRWPVEQDLPGERGIPVQRVRALAERWATAWDWRAQEAALNAWPQVETTVDGTRVHALHVRSPEPGDTAHCEPVVTQSPGLRAGTVGGAHPHDGGDGSARHAGGRPVRAG